MPDKLTRRTFVAAASTTGVVRGASTMKPALLGGTPVRQAPFAAWPIFDQNEENGMLAVVRSGKWGRGNGRNVEKFEHEFASRTGAKHCLAVTNGTSALITSLGAMGVGPGDEVIVPPYTFIATVNAVLMMHALPVFVDIDPATFQIDATKIEAAITDRTAAIMPVHIGGGVGDLDAILKVGAKRKIPVIEDACQAHMAEWRGRKAGSLGTTGCFSFQASKNLNSGEGGAVLTSDSDLAEKCYSFHNNSRGHGSSPYAAPGCNLRMTEMQAALLIAQGTRLEEQMVRRSENAKYLTSLFDQIPGVQPARTPEGCTRNAFHLFMSRMDPAKFAGLTRDQFLKALRAEGIPASGGYAPLNREQYLETTLNGRGFRAIYSQERLAKWRERNQCPANDKLCREAFWLTQNMLLGPRSDMEQIAEAVRKIQANAAALAKA